MLCFHTSQVQTTLVKTDQKQREYMLVFRCCMTLALLLCPADIAKENETHSESDTSASKKMDQNVSGRG